jgi:WD40 repeat protein
MRSIIVAFILTALFTSYALGNSQPELKQVLQSPDPFPFEYFGGAVDTHADRILVGATDDYNFTGEAFLFDSLTGDLLHTFKHPNSTYGDFFGVNVALGDQYAVVVADDNFEEFGHAYIYDLQSGALSRSIAFPSPVISPIENAVGNDVAVLDNNILIGAPQDGSLGNKTGRAYLYDAVTGASIRTFESPSPDKDDSFGGAVALTNDHVIVGAYGDDTDGTNAGQVYVFNRITGELLNTLRSPSPNANEYFGIYAAIEGDRLLVGGVGSTDGRGEAFLYDVNTGDLIAELSPPANIGQARFGSGVEIHNGIAAVGAPYATINGIRSGTVYLYDATSGAYLQTLPSPNPQDHASYGSGIAMSGNTVVVAAFSETWFDFENGRAYVFELQVPEPTQFTIISTFAGVLLTLRTRLRSLCRTF